VELVVFDIAGTLIEDHNEVADAFLESLRQNQIEVAESEINEFKGSSKREVIRHFVYRQFGKCGNLPLVERTYGEFRFLLERKFVEKSIVSINGAIETLASLRGRGMKVATTTGFYREIRDKILESLRWQNVFDANVCSDDVEHGRPAPDMIFKAMHLTGVTDAANVANVGDTPLDLQSGTAAGCGVVVGVLTGVHTRQRLEKEPHTHILSSLAGIPGLFD
jgi:phosphonatase-like hydrolase